MQFRKLILFLLILFLLLIAHIFLSSSAFAGDFIYDESEGTITITGYTGCPDAGAVEIPSNIGGYPVVGIGDYAFYGCSGLTSVTIPDSVTSIGDAAFYGCSGLTSVIIPNSVTSIGDDAFAYCSGLTSVTIGKSVTSIGVDAFWGCSGLTSIIVDASNTVYSSQDGVLYNKDRTVLIEYPYGKSGGFTIPDSVTSIGDYAFFNCSGLTSVTIPDSVTSIGSYAFYGCSGLTIADFYGNAPSMGDEGEGGGLWGVCFLWLLK